MYCKYCGEQIDDNSKFCNHCGKNLNSGAVGVSLPNISFDKFEFNALMFSSIGFIVTVILCFPTWLSISIPDIWKGRSTYSASLFNLLKLFESAANLSNEIGNEAYETFTGIATASWIFIIFQAVVLLIYFIGVYKKKRKAYATGEIFSFLNVVFSLSFVLIVSSVASGFSQASYDIINISSSACPVVIIIINIITFVWLLLESKTLPEVDDDDDEEYEFENEDYEDDLTDENAEEFWNEIKKTGYGDYRQYFK